MLWSRDFERRRCKTIAMNVAARKPAVAGRFYPGNRETLLRDVTQYVAESGQRLPALGCVVPHAGYMYSGHVAGAVYAKIELPRLYIILCPNHTGMGKPLAIMTEGEWLTPLGVAAIHGELASALQERFPLLENDAYAHLAEHAAEVHLPFLQAQVKEFEFVPICVGVGTFDLLAQLGEAIGDVVGQQHEPVLVIASSDMNHYETDSITRRKDHKAIEKLLARDPQGLYETIRKEEISMCGYGPSIAMLTATERLGAKKAELVKYATSADVSGDRQMCVGYAGVVVSR